jgi:hypothetical protein
LLESKRLPQNQLPEVILPPGTDRPAKFDEIGKPLLLIGGFGSLAKVAQQKTPDCSGVF